MKRYLATVICMILLAGWTATDAKAQASAAEPHVAAAKAAASPKTASPEPWHAFDYLFNRECAAPRTGGRGGAEAAEAIGSNVPLERGEYNKLVPKPIEEWYVRPTRVFDNLYYVGTKTESTWALTTSAGIILLNTNFEWVTPELLSGMRQVSLDPVNIKYIVVTHAHSDQFWGVTAIQRIVPGVHVLMSEADWDAVAKDNSPPRLKPKKDMVITDGQKLTLGDTTITFYITPGPSAGTTSVILPLKQGDQRHVGAMWGGTGANLVRSGVRLFTDRQTMLKTQIAGMQRFINAQNQAGVDTLVTVHAALDKGLDKLKAIKPGDNPFVSKDDVQRFNTILLECTQAKLAWASGS